MLPHLHGDHFDRVARRELDRNVPIVTTGHAAKSLERSGFRSCAGLRTWDARTFTDGDATLRVTVHYDDYGMFTSPVSNFLTEARDRKTAAEVRLLRRGDRLSLAPAR